MALGLSSIVSPQIKMTGEIGKSVKAFHAADSGIERLSEAIYVGYDYYDYSSLSGQCDEKTIWGTPTDVICECPEAQRDCSYMTEGRCNNTVCLGYCGEENGFVCLSGEYCREVDHRCQPLPVCRQRIEDGYGTTNVADNIQVEGCNNTCYACNGSGRCVGKTCDYSAATALGCIAGTESCRYCDAGNCDFYTFGEHECEMGHKCNREGECAALCETNEEGITACIEINYSGLATQITSFTIDAPDGIQVDKTISLSAKLTYVSDGIAIADETIFFEDTTGDGENPIPIGDATTLSDGVATKNYLIPGGAIIGEHILTAKYAGNRLKLALSSENTTTFDVLNTEPTVDDAYIKPPVPGFTDTLICNFTISDINILDDLTADVVNAYQETLFNKNKKYITRKIIGEYVK